MNPCTLTITLEQHTPLVHFQHTQPEATLRATEVKPRLDAFIRQQLGRDFPAHWRVGKEKGQHPNALDYRLWVSISNRLRPIEIRTHGQGLVGSYFGDAMGLEWGNGLTLTFSSRETGVLDAIYQHIVSFFVLHNFGQRQSKGFGSFTVSHINGTELQGYKNEPFNQGDFENILRQSYGTVYKLTNATDTPLKRIHQEYQLLKAGTNPGHENSYRKSELFKYFVNKKSSPIRWEKRKIKQEINKIIESRSATFTAQLEQTSRPPIDVNNATGVGYNSYEDIQTNTYQYIRAILGLAETNEYLTKGNLKYIVHINHVFNDKKNKIERFASPIRFKVFNNRVYLIALDEDAIALILKQSFQFVLSAKRRQGNEWTPIKNGDTLITENLGAPLKTPDSFDLPDFLAKHINRNNWEKL